MMSDLERFINDMPKAELHLHIEGTFEPELMFELADRNKIRLKFSDVDRLREAYNFQNLQEFLDIYYAGAGLLIKERDFYDLTMAYMKKASSQKVLHTEIFFDPQTHTVRGIALPEVINGIMAAIQDAGKNHGISAKLIMCFLRHLEASDAMHALEEALPFREQIIAVGLDSTEAGNPPEKFREVFSRAQQYGFLTVAHAGEEGPASYISGALDHLNAARIDHGIRSMDDPELIARLVRERIPLTVCPLSNLKLKVVKRMQDHPLRKFLEKGMVATVNSDDPAYFGGYVNENYTALHESLDLTKGEIIQLARNSFEASFITEAERDHFTGQLDQYISRYDAVNNDNR